MTIDGEPWFVAKDVAEALGYSDSSNPSRLIAAVPEEWKGVKPIHTPGGVQSILCLSEQGLYFFLNRSDKPAALPLQKYVAGTILPTIRKTGGYLTPRLAEAALSDTDALLPLLKAATQQLEAYRDRCRLQEREIKVLAPKAEYAEEVLQSTGLHTVDSIAVHLGVSAIRLNKFLAGLGWIYKRGKDWYPLSDLRPKGLCDFHIVAYIDRDGEKQTREHLKWTEAGRKAIIEKWNKVKAVSQ